MAEEGPKKAERKIPFDPPIKIALLFAHFVGFSIWYGKAVMGADVQLLFPVITGASGALLVIRELYKEGFVWLVLPEGACTIVKVLLLAVGHFLMQYAVHFLSVIALLGILGSHLPERIKERRVFGGRSEENI